jgi:hypothetical protein
MNRILRNLGIGLAALALAGCSKHEPITAPAATGGSASFSVVAAIGTSVSAGYESGGLVVHHQQKAFPYAFARQVGAAYAIPSVTADGLPPLLHIAGWTAGGNPIINNAGRTPGAPDNLAWPAPYNNMAVPGAILLDVTNDGRYSNPLLPFQFIARPTAKLGSILDQVALLNPTFVTFEMGANEVLGPASQGSGIPIMSVPGFSALLDSTLDSLAVLMPNTKVAIFTVPDITSLPYFTTIRPWLDPNGVCKILGPGLVPLNADDLVLLPAGPLLATGQGVPSGLPCGGAGTALPGNMVLLKANVDFIQAAVDGYNTAIRTEAAARGYALVDLNGLLKQGASTGFEFQGQTYTSDFVTGGLFSLDGVHPTDFAHGVICNALIEAVNATFGAHVPLLNLADWATATSSRARPAGIAQGFPVIENADQVYGALFGWRGIRTPAP